MERTVTCDPTGQRSDDDGLSVERSKGGTLGTGLRGVVETEVPLFHHPPFSYLSTPSLARFSKPGAGSDPDARSARLAAFPA